MGFGGSSRWPHHLVHHPRITPCPSSSPVMPCVNPSGPWVKDVRVASWAPSIRFGPSGAEEAGWGTTSECRNHGVPKKRRGETVGSKGGLVWKRAAVYWCFSMVFSMVLRMFNFRHISPTLHHYLNCMDFLLAVFKTWYIHTTLLHPSIYSQSCFYMPVGVECPECLVVAFSAISSAQ